MKIMKFGGSCMKDASDIETVTNIISVETDRKVVIASAINGVTDILQECLEKVKTDDESVAVAIKRLRMIHEQLASDTIKNKRILDRTLESLNYRIQKLERLLYGVAYTEELTDRTRALVLSFGERLSVVILEGVLRSIEVDAESLESDKIGITTDESFENATAVLPSVRKNLGFHIVPLLKKKIVPVITGYFGCTVEGKITTFGRNGSDYSAAVIANVLGADRLEIWKDVDGFMTADPKFVDSARLIDRLSYYESAELSYFGAKILHPRTIEPLVDTDIPIFIRNIHLPTHHGTCICKGSERSTGKIVKSVTYNNNLSVLKIQGAGVGHKPGIIGELGRELSNSGVNIYSVITSQTCINILIDRKDLQKSLQAVKKLVGGVIEKIESRDSIALIAVVGEGLLKTHGLAAKVFTAVARQKVNVEMISAGASETAYYFIVDGKDLEKTVNAVHGEFFGE